MPLLRPDLMDREDASEILNVATWEIENKTRKHKDWEEGLCPINMYAAIREELLGMVTVFDETIREEYEYQLEAISNND